MTEHDLGYGALRDIIERELAARPIFILGLSPTSVGSRWVSDETDAAMELQRDHPDRIILPVLALATQCEIPLFFRRKYKRRNKDRAVFGLSPSEAAGRVVHALALVPVTMPTAPVPAISAETGEQAWERGKRPSRSRTPVKRRSPPLIELLPSNQTLQIIGVIRDIP